MARSPICGEIDRSRHILSPSTDRQVASYPWFADSLAICNAIAEESAFLKTEPRRDVQGIVGMPPLLLLPLLLQGSQHQISPASGSRKKLCGSCVRCLTLPVPHAASSCLSDNEASTAEPRLGSSSGLPDLPIPSLQGLPSPEPAHEQQQQQRGAPSGLSTPRSSLDWGLNTQQPLLLDSAWIAGLPDIPMPLELFGDL